MTDLFDEITTKHIISAIRKIESGAPNRFAKSTGYDILFEGKRFAPKAVFGVAIGEHSGKELGPSDFKGGLQSKCFRVLKKNGFEIVTKGDTASFPGEIDKSIPHYEGALKTIQVNKYERDGTARKKCISHYGETCQVCDFDFKERYGALGEGFIHVHHVVPLADIGEEYQVDPIKDLSPVCPNCHAMLHKRQPPYSVDELKQVLIAAAPNA